MRFAQVLYVLVTLELCHCGDDQGYQNVLPEGAPPEDSPYIPIHLAETIPNTPLPTTPPLRYTVTITNPNNALYESFFYNYDDNYINLIVPTRGVSINKILYNGSKIWIPMPDEQLEYCKIFLRDEQPEVLFIKTTGDLLAKEYYKSKTDGDEWIDCSSTCLEKIKMLKVFTPKKGEAIFYLEDSQDTEECTIFETHLLGITTKHFFPKSGYDIVKVKHQGRSVWRATENKRCLFCTIYFIGTSPYLLHMKIASPEKYYHKYFEKRQRWRRITVELFNDKLETLMDMHISYSNGYENLKNISLELGQKPSLEKKNLKSDINKPIEVIDKPENTPQKLERERSRGFLRIFECICPCKKKSKRHISDKKKSDTPTANVSYVKVPVKYIHCEFENTTEKVTKASLEVPLEPPLVEASGQKRARLVSITSLEDCPFLSVGSYGSVINLVVPDEELYQSFDYYYDNNPIKLIAPLPKSHVTRLMNGDEVIWRSRHREILKYAKLYLNKDREPDIALVVSGSLCVLYKNYYAKNGDLWKVFIGNYQEKIWALRTIPDTTHTIAMNLENKEDTDQCRVFVTHLYGVHTYFHSPKLGYVINEVKDGDIPVWKAEKGSDKKCLSCDVYTSENMRPLLLLMVKDRDQNYALHFEKLDLIWNRVSLKTFNKRLNNMTQSEQH